MPPFDTPPLRVSRPIAACAPCRRTKSKCDGKLPVCSSCEKTGKAEQCASNTSDTRETSYVATLETRKANLERAQAEAMIRRKSIIGVVEATTSASSSSSTRPQPLELSTSRKRADGKKEATNVDDLVGDFGLLSISATSRDFYGFTPETSYARFTLVSSANQPLSTNDAQRTRLPSREDARRMIHHSIARSLMHLPIVDESTVWASFDKVYSGSSPVPLDVYLVNIFLAIYFSLANKAQGPSTGDNSLSSKSAEFLAHAIKQTPDVLRPGSVTSIQALLLLAVHAWLDPTYFDSWTLVGFASRAMVDIGMHHEPPKSNHKPKPGQDIRRCVFWCVYSLDRLASITYKRPFSFSDESTAVAMPSKTSCSASALALFKLRQMQSNFYNALYQPSSAPSYDGLEDPWAYIWRMHTKLGDWLQQQSETITDPGSMSLLELEFEASCAFLLGPSPRCPSSDTHAALLRQQHISKIAALARNNYDLFYLTTLEAMAG